ncbi:MAG: hypothetical protein B6245_08890 [Desulfobacteraceae bacterium 4572_88]|nr:MAG: hypothetical protein B6245_08890 [Desulfobacteraceae bacterium 4572_88]
MSAENTSGNNRCPQFINAPSLTFNPVCGKHKKNERGGNPAFSSSYGFSPIRKKPGLLCHAQFFYPDHSI